MTLSKVLMIVGGLLLGAGLFLHFGGSLAWLGKLPGDIRVEKAGFRFYLPITTSLIVSLLLSLLFKIFRS